MHKNNITVVGSLNMDMVVNIPHIPKIGETISAKTLKKIPGGKGANQAVAAAKLGANVNMIGCVGTDEFGHILMSNLEKEGVQITGIAEETNTSTGLAFINVSDEGDNNIVVVAGANESCSIKHIQKHRNILEKSQILILQLEIPLETVTYTIEMAKELDKMVILNPAPAIKLSDSLLKMVDVLTPNETELEILTDTKIESIDDVKKSAKLLLDKGVKTIIVTMGEKGAVLVNNHDCLHVPVIKVEAMDTTAAGDSFTAALAVGLCEGMSYPDAIEFANKVASIVVTREGAQTSLPTREEVIQLN